MYLGIILRGFPWNSAEKTFLHGILREGNCKIVLAVLGMKSKSLQILCPAKTSLKFTWYLSPAMPLLGYGLLLP